MLCDALRPRCGDERVPILFDFRVDIVRVVGIDRPDPPRFEDFTFEVVLRKPLIFRLFSPLSLRDARSVLTISSPFGVEGTSARSRCIFNT